MKSILHEYRKKVGWGFVRTALLTAEKLREKYINGTHTCMGDNAGTHTHLTETLCVDIDI